ncbi:MAG: secondary thiamine-phosphate synthase enzyme YjbQ [Chloroflexota bacterium]|nr:MAG: secondary thiamine-phosphate synthase enzyme [Chloroflexota bacterium]
MLETVRIQTPNGESLIDVTAQVREIVQASNVQNGLCALFVPHTTAAVTINSGLDPMTLEDLTGELARLVPKRVDFKHQYDTPADAAAHIKAALIGHSATLIIAGGNLLLGGSQSILFFEFDGPRSRTLHVKVLSD